MWPIIRGIRLNQCRGHLCSLVLNLRSIGRKWKVGRTLEMGAIKGIQNHAHDCNNEVQPHTVLARRYFALHISLYKIAKQVEPQL